MLEKIKKLRKEKNALIIAHYYADPKIQDLADYVGDSLAMAVYAKEAQYDMAVVCGVKFMAETFKAMNPQKKILIPDLEAGCSLADTCTPAVFKYFKSKYPGAFVMTYINSSLEIKALSDVVVTSANAVKIAKNMPKDKTIIFGPDRNLGAYAAKQAGREFVLFPGNCFVHTSFSDKGMLDLKTKHPNALIIAHPECEASILSQSDFVGSTGQMLNFTKESECNEFIVMTESGILHQMKKDSPHKTFIPGPDVSGNSCSECPHMKLNTLEKIYECLLHETPEITVDSELARKALVAINRMMEYS